MLALADLRGGARDAPPRDRMTDACENITLPLADGKKVGSSVFGP